jgi:hypothetical protein
VTNDEAVTGSKSLFLLFSVLLKGMEQIPEPIVLVILKSACFLIHALLPRDLKARGLKSAGPEKSEVVPHAVKCARYPALLGKSRTFDKIVQN